MDDARAGPSAPDTDILVVGASPTGPRSVWAIAATAFAMGRSTGMTDWNRVPLGTPRIEKRDAMTLAGIRERHAFEGFDFAVFPAQLQKVKDQLGGVSDRIGAAIYEVFWDMFSGADAFGYLAGVEIADGSGLPDDFTRVRLPAQRYAMFRNVGNADSRDTVTTIWHDWLPGSGYEPAGGPEFLEVSGDGTAPESGGGAVEIWVPVKDKRGD